MSVKNVKAFYEKVEGDKTLQAKLKALDRKAEDSVKEAIAELTKIASGTGFEFTIDDFFKAKSEKLETSTDELKKVTGHHVGQAISPLSFTKLCLCEYPDNSYSSI